MHISITRIFKDPIYTTGRLHIDRAYFCDTLEDLVRELPASCPDMPCGAACRYKEKVFAGRPFRTRHTKDPWSAVRISGGDCRSYCLSFFVFARPEVRFHHK